MTSVSDRPASLRTGLVLGAGGTVGLAYHAGVLRALEAVSGFVPNEADLIVGTSAGSVAGAYLRSGWTTEDFWQMAMGTHPLIADLSPDELAAQRAALFSPRFHSVPDLLRQGLGSAYVLGRSLWRVPLPPVPGVLRHAFPGGIFEMAEARRRFLEDLPKRWPSRPLWLCAVDIMTGRRVVLGRPGSPLASLHQGVLASCAIPGLYPPVVVGSRALVDGGTHSTTNLDLAGSCDLVVAVVPMAWDTASPPNRAAQVPRRFAARRLAVEVAHVRRKGTRVLLLRPTGAEIRLHGLNLMRRAGWEDVARMAYEVACRTLDTPRFRQGLADLAA
jgi:NTE family protein